jgi:hypothetical protein
VARPFPQNIFSEYLMPGRHQTSGTGAWPVPLKPVTAITGILIGNYAATHQLTGPTP